MKLVVFLMFMVSSIAIAQTTPAELISKTCGIYKRSPSQKAICGILIQKEISANMGTVIEQEGDRYLSRQSVLRSDGAYQMLFDQVERQLGGKIPGARRVQILNTAGVMSIGSLIHVIDTSLVR